MIQIIHYFPNIIIPGMASQKSIPKNLPKLGLWTPEERVDQSKQIMQKMAMVRGPLAYGTNGWNEVKHGWDKQKYKY